MIRTVEAAGRHPGQRPSDTAYTGAAEHLPVVWVALRSAMRRVLDEVTLADVLTGGFPEHVRAFAEARSLDGPLADRGRALAGLMPVRARRPHPGAGLRMLR